MAGVPVLGTYVSEDKCYSIKIASADASTGAIIGVYTASFSPAGPLTAEGNIGGYSWVFSAAQGRDGVAPFTLRINGNWRPDDRSYALKETWIGAYLPDNSLKMEGSRVYVDKQGNVQVVSLGGRNFVLQK